MQYVHIQMGTHMYAVSYRIFHGGGGGGGGGQCVRKIIIFNTSEIAFQCIDQN